MTKNVVVTGSTKGIGRAMARELHRRGHHVVVSGRDEEALRSLVAELEGTEGGTVVGQLVDVSDPDSVEELWAGAVGKLGTVDLWVNNAGVAHTTQTIVDTTPAAVRSMVETNMLGTIFGSQTAVRGMTAQGGGQLFNVLGGGSDGRIRPGMGVYGATKRGLDMFTRALVKEVDGTGVRVGQVRPGILVTDGWLREAAAAPEQVAQQRRMLNILVDHVDEVAPELVARMLASTRNGEEIAWLTSARLARRFMSPGYARKNDKLARYGL
ncbi:SDR family oxidoreductase [Nocardioides campestrisoli]|uniref:SDR family oxidoreductase n=1 Tax=Nocardioides campestrisoli TaxID=2736757 RepID=UPI0015E7D578|nr:SDR family oxidoreductase [Nocardioides campestrisoli]